MPERPRVFATPLMLEDAPMMEWLRANPDIDLIEPIIFDGKPLGFEDAEKPAPPREG